MPTLLIGLTGDQAAFPAMTAQMRDTLGAADRTFTSVRGTHFGGATRHARGRCPQRGAPARRECDKPSFRVRDTTDPEVRLGSDRQEV